MYNRSAIIHMKINHYMEDYVEFLRKYHDGVEELVEHDLAQPFRAGYNAYVRYERDNLSEKYPVKPIILSKSKTVEKAIELRREYEGEPDELVLQRILYNHFGLEEPYGDCRHPTTK